MIFNYSSSNILIPPPLTQTVSNLEGGYWRIESEDVYE